jgi:hypothetical protein
MFLMILNMSFVAMVICAAAMDMQLTQYFVKSARKKFWGTRSSCNRMKKGVVIIENME